MNHGLTQQQLNTIKHILIPYAEKIDKIALFGSRAKGTYQPHSDIDLVIFGHGDEKMEARLWTLFHESNLPYKVDVKLYNLIKHDALKAHIEQCHQKLWGKDDLLKQG